MTTLGLRLFGRDYWDAERAKAKRYMDLRHFLQELLGAYAIAVPQTCLDSSEAQSLIARDLARALLRTGRAT